jgi:hypothetical protein
MRRLTCTSIVLVALVAAVGCRRDEKIKLEATDESQPTLAATVHAADPSTGMQLVRGFHAIEQNAWRWTMGQFAVTLQPPAGAADRGASLVVKLSVPETILQKVNKTTLSASVQKKPIGSQTYTTSGEQTFRADIPPALIRSEGVTVEFSLDPFLPGGTLDGRELGIVFVSASLEPK